MSRAYSMVLRSPMRMTASATTSNVSSRSDCCRASPCPSFIPRQRTASTSFLFERQQNVRRLPSSRTSKTDWSRVRGMKDKDIKKSAEHPEANVKHIVRGIARQGLKPLSGKTSISLRVDAEVLEWFKAQGPGYQTRINAVLKAFKDASV